MKGDYEAIVTAHPERKLTLGIRGFGPNAVDYFEAMFGERLLCPFCDEDHNPPAKMSLVEKLGSAAAGGFPIPHIRRP